MLAVAKEEDGGSTIIAFALRMAMKLMNYEYFCVPGPSSESDK